MQTAAKYQCSNVGNGEILVDWRSWQTVEGTLAENHIISAAKKAFQ